MSHDYGIRAGIRRLRRGLRQRVSLWLARRRGTVAPIRAALPAPATILVCRLNARLGNALFVTPLLRSLAATYPHAAIDLLIRGAANAPLLASLPGVRRVYVFPEGVAMLWRAPILIRRLRRNRYDLAVDPSTQSSNDRSAQALSRARYKLGFARDTQWVRLTHAAPVPRDERHHARQAVTLLSEAIADIQPELVTELGVYPDQATRARARQRLADAVGENAARPLVGFFAEATGKKGLGADWWRGWRAALAADAAGVTLVQVVAPGASPLAADIPTIGTPDLLELAAILGAMDLFVAADSGPMHLAAAAGVPVLGLFLATDPKRYAPLGRDCHSMRAPLAPESVAAQAAHMLQRDRA